MERCSEGQSPTIMIMSSRRSRLLCALLLLAQLGLGQMWAGAQAETNALQFETAIRAFEKADQTSPPPTNAILFIGSSSIRLWTNLAHDFPGKPVFNRGFGGSHISDAVHYVDRIVIPYWPRLIVFYAGGNDIHAGKTPEQVLGDFKAFVVKVHRQLPKVRIHFISIAPNPSRWKEVAKVKAANQLIADYISTNKSLTFIDVFSAMLGTDGLPRDIYRADKLHMNLQGYEIWTKIIGPHLE